MEASSNPSGNVNTGEGSGTQSGAEAQISQENPTQDSGLQTPQPDQPVPTEGERQVEGTAGSVGESGQRAEGTVDPPAYPTSAEQQETHDQRESDREQQRRDHAERTGGGEVREGEKEAARDEHNARTAGESTQVDEDQDQS